MSDQHPDTSYQLPGTNAQPLRVRLDLGVKKLKYTILFLAVATGTMGAIIAIFAYTKFSTPAALNIGVIQEEDNLNAAEVKTLTDKISQIAVLPENETPTVLTVSDLTKLKGNPFFVNAKLKNKIIIYKKTGRIILYDPFGNKIVNMGPYSENSASGSPSPTPASASETPTAASSPTPTSTPSPGESPTPEPSASPN